MNVSTSSTFALSSSNIHITPNSSKCVKTIESDKERIIECSKPTYQRTIEEIMNESDIPFHSLSDDRFESQYHLSQSTIEITNNDGNDMSITDNKLKAVLSNDDILTTEQIGEELNKMKTKSENIEAMVDKFLFQN